MSPVTDPDLPPWARGLGFQPHPEGGFFAETYRSAATVQTAAGSRALATSILFLLLPGQESEWHLVTSDELWLHQRGGPLLLGLGGDDPARPGAARDHLLGTDAAAGENPQLLVPAGTWQRARPAGPEPVMVGCVVTPGFEFADFRLFRP